MQFNVYNFFWRAFLLCCFSGATTLLFAQHGHEHHHHAHQDEVRTICGFDAVHQERMANDQQYRMERAQIDALVREYAARYHQQHMQKTAQEGGPSTYVIPVVVHVVWGDTTSNTPGSDSISGEQVESQFRVFHEDFRNLPGTLGYNDIGIDSKIELSLATIDPQGNPSSGILYHYDPVLSHHERNSEAFDLKNNYTWPKDRYLNIWLVNEIPGGGGAGGGTILGYAQFPQVSNPLDGLVIRTDCWGTVGTAGGPGGDNNFGRTGTHEVGHWINLFHTFQGGCGTDCQNTGDQVCDTRPTAQQNFGFPQSRLNSCTNDSPDEGDNYRNYMDYAGDLALNHFTEGQLIRSWAVLDQSTLPQRFNLWQNSNLQATGTGKYKAPTAIFAADRRFTAPGGTIEFYDYSRNQATNWEWSFPGGNPASSTDMSPEVTYDTPGFYDVTLTVNNESGTPSTLTLENYIHVLPEGTPIAAGETYYEGFEITEFPPDVPSDWTVLNPDSANQTISLTWDITAIASGFDSSGFSMRMRMGNYSNLDQRDGLVSPVLDLSDWSDGAAVSFAYAYQAYSEQSRVWADTFRVYASSDGGRTWQEVYQKGGTELSYDGGVSSNDNFQPDASQWVRDTAFLPASLVTESTLLKFETENDFGANLYLDDIEVEEFQTVSRPELTVLDEASLRVVPNPVKDIASIQMHLLKNTTATVQLYNMAGSRVVELPAKQLAPGQHSLSLPMSNLPNGVYLVRVQAGDQLVTKRLLKQ